MFQRFLVAALVLTILIQLCYAGPVTCAQKANVLEVGEVEEIQQMDDQTPLELTNAINSIYTQAHQTLQSGKMTEAEIHGTLSFEDLEMLELTAEEQKMADIQKEYETEYAKISPQQTTPLKFFPELWAKAKTEMEKRGVVLSIKRFLMWEEHKKVVLARLVAKYKDTATTAEIQKKYVELIATYNNIIKNSNVKVTAYQTFHGKCLGYYYQGQGKTWHDALVKLFTERKLDPKTVTSYVGYNIYIQCTYLFNKQWAAKLKAEVAKKTAVTDGCVDKQVCQYDCRHLTNLDCSKATEPTTGFMDLTNRIKIDGNETTAYNYACKTGFFVAKPTAGDKDLQAQFQSNLEKVTKLSFNDLIKERPTAKQFLGHIDYQYLNWIQTRTGAKVSKVQAEIVASLINFKDGLRGFAKLCHRNPDYLKFENLALIYNQYLTNAEEVAFNPATSKIASTDPFALAYFRQRVWRSRWAAGQYSIQEYLDAYNYFQGYSKLILIDFIYDLQFVTSSKRAYCSCENYGTFYSYFTQNPTQMASYRVQDLSFYQHYTQQFAQKCLTICKLKKPIPKKKTVFVIAEAGKNKQTEKIGTEKDLKKQNKKLKKSGEKRVAVEKPKTIKTVKKPKKNKKILKLEKKKRRELEKEIKKNPKLKPKPVFIKKVKKVIQEQVKKQIEKVVKKVGKKSRKVGRKSKKGKNSTKKVIKKMKKKSGKGKALKKKSKKNFKKGLKKKSTRKVVKTKKQVPKYSVEKADNWDMTNIVRK
eukprot:gene11377-4544_t